MRMCPLWPLHIICLYLLALGPLWFASCYIQKSTDIWNVLFEPSQVKKVLQSHVQPVNFSAEFKGKTLDEYVIHALIDDPVIASSSKPDVIFQSSDGNIMGSFNITGNFFGYTSAKLCLSKKNIAVTNGNSLICEQESKPLKISVIRMKTIWDRIFTVTVIVLVSIIFINFGCTLDIDRLKDAIVRPIGPLIGLVSHFLLLPLISYILGLIFFSNSPMLRLGLFFSGIVPAGGASNIWTAVLGGNLDLSITMTAVSTLASFALIPAWVFTLGSEIFSDSEMGVPYKNFFSSGLSPFISLAIGYLIQVYQKKFANLMVKMLKPFSAFLIIFIIVFATVTNFDLFQLFSWRIIIAGLLLPWIGYAGGWILSTALRQTPENRLAISIETGIQNTGMSIFLLRTCLEEPDSDITTIIPVTIATMTPIPLLIYFLIQRFNNRGNEGTKLMKNTDCSQDQQCL